MIGLNPAPYQRADVMPAIDDAQQAAKILTDAFARSKRTVVLTGAGVSTDSGIPDFRSPGGVWSRMTPIEFDDFLHSEDARREDWRRRFAMAELFAEAEPNATHRVLAKMAAEDELDLLVTQNIDGLHRRAGTPEDKLVEIHGTGSHASCLDCNTRMEIETAQQFIADTDLSPRCPRCKGLVKAAIISFGQAMPEELMMRAQIEAAGADLFVALGTSLVVYPVAGLPLIAREQGAALIIASKLPTEMDHLAHAVLRAPLDETFQHVERLKFDENSVAGQSH